MNQSVAWRSPAVGLIPPHSSVTVRIQIPFDTNVESPLLLTFKAKSSLSLRDVRSDQVTIDNLSDRATPYLLVIIPQTALALPSMDWKQRFQLLKKKRRNLVKENKGYLNELPPTPPL